MHFTTAVLALAATALAAPSSQTKRDGATCDALGQYSCSADGTKILQCDATLHLAEIGPCPTGTVCEYVEGTGDVPTLPFCKVPATKRDVTCSAPGTYQCGTNPETGVPGIRVCDSTNHLQWNGDCPADTHCDYLNNIPFCLDNSYHY